MNALSDPHLVRQFEDEIWTFDGGHNKSNDEILEHLIEYTKNASVKIFGRSVTKPRQQWMSDSTWEHVRSSAMLRRLQCKLFGLRASFRLAFFFYQWSSVRPAEFQCNDSIAGVFNVSITRNYGWMAIVQTQLCCARLAWCHKTEAAVFSCIHLHKKIPKVLAYNDKQKYYHDLAFQASSSASRNDFAASFKIIRSLSGFKPRSIKSVKKKWLFHSLRK